LIPNERAQHSRRFATGRRRSVTGPVTFISRRRCYLGAGDEATHTVHYAAVSFLTLLKKVLERLATSDKTTIAIEKQRDGKMRVTSGSWDGQKIFLKDQVIEVRHTNADGRLHVARKTKRGTTGTRPMSPMTPNSLGGVASDGFIDDCNGVTGVVTALHPNVTALHANVTALRPTPGCTSLAKPSTTTTGTRWSGGRYRRSDRVTVTASQPVVTASQRVTASQSSTARMRTCRNAIRSRAALSCASQTLGLPSAARGTESAITGFRPRARGGFRLAEVNLPS
jgi:hypothetical protein